MKRFFTFALILALITSCLVGCCIPTSTEETQLNITVGETATYEDLEFTLLGVERYVDTSDWVWDEAAEGKEFVILKIKVKNVGTESEHINMFYEESYCDDVAVDPVSLLYNYDGETIWGDVAAGKMREGYIAYELPIGWETIEFEYQEVLSSSKIVMTAHASQITDSPKKPDAVIESSPEENEENVAPSPLLIEVGQTATLGNLSFTFVGIEKYVDTSDWVWDEAAEGKEFVILKIKVKNVGTESNRINSLHEDSYCDDIAVDPVSYLYNYEGETIWGEVAADKMREGYIAYELPIGWSKIEFIYTPSLYGNSNNQVVFVGYSSDIN